MTQRTFDFSLSAMLPLAWETIRRPRPVARQIIDLGLPAGLAWLMLLTIATVSVVIGQGASLMLTPDVDSVEFALLSNPILMAGIQWAVLVLTIYGMHYIGAVMGGQGQFEDSLSAMAWLQFVMLCVQVIQTVALFVLPGVADVITLLAFILLMWLLTNFVAEVHGFQNLALVFVMILVSAFAISFALTIVLSILGLVGSGAVNA